MKTASAYSEIYSDRSIVVLNKQSGVLTAADRYNPDAPRLDTAAEPKYGPLYAVHRLDKDTSGIIVYARTREAHRSLSMQFEARKIEKIYHCLVYGRPLWQEKRVAVPLLVDGDARHRTVVSKKFGKPSATVFRVIGPCGPYSWVEARPESGRTHQIRAHLVSAGFSIVCDPLYGGNQKPLRLSEIKRNWRGDEFEERPLVSRLALHAYRLAFFHPDTNERAEFSAPYPKDMEAARRQLAKLFGTDPLAEDS